MAPTDNRPAVDMDNYESLPPYTDCFVLPKAPIRDYPDDSDDDSDNGVPRPPSYYLRRCPRPGNLITPEDKMAPSKLGTSDDSLWRAEGDEYLHKMDRSYVEGEFKTWLEGDEVAERVADEDLDKAQVSITWIRARLAHATEALVADADTQQLRVTISDSTWSAALSGTVTLRGRTVAADALLLAWALASTPVLADAILAKAKEGGCSLPVDNRVVVREGSAVDEQMGEDDRGGVYLLELGSNRVYVGNTASYHQRLLQHRSGELNGRMTKLAQGLAHERGHNLAMIAVWSAKCGALPTLAAHALEAMLVAALGTSLGPDATQTNVVRTLPQPALPIGIWRAAWMRLVEVSQDSEMAWDIVNPAVFFPKPTLDDHLRGRARKFYTGLFADLLEEAPPACREIGPFAQAFFAAGGRIGHLRECVIESGLEIQPLPVISFWFPGAKEFRKQHEAFQETEEYRKRMELFYPEGWEEIEPDPEVIDELVAKWKPHVDLLHAKDALDERLRQEKRASKRSQGR
ncbi:hypothetical protein IAT38_003321 [Cryptococcus sp. DSM 104549]